MQYKERTVDRKITVLCRPPQRRLTIIVFGLQPGALCEQQLDNAFMALSAVYDSGV
jgi:hypothetical protein